MSLEKLLNNLPERKPSQIQVFKETLKTLKKITNADFRGINWSIVQKVGDDISEYWMRFWQANPKDLTEKERYESDKWWELLHELSFIFHNNAPDFGRSYTDEYWFEM